MILSWIAWMKGMSLQTAYEQQVDFISKP